MSTKKKNLTTAPATPYTRKEKYLSVIAGATELETLPTNPQNREERYLEAIADAVNKKQYFHSNIAYYSDDTHNLAFICPIINNKASMTLDDLKTWIKALSTTSEFYSFDPKTSLSVDNVAKQVWSIKANDDDTFSLTYVDVTLITITLSYSGFGYIDSSSYEIS